MIWNCTGVDASSQRTICGPVSTYASARSGSMSPCDSESRYISTSSRLSSTPRSAWCGLTGIHTIPPDHALVPPSRSAFSYTATEEPPSWAARAAVEGGGPAPEHDHVDAVRTLQHR